MGVHEQLLQRALDLEAGKRVPRPPAFAASLTPNCRKMEAAGNLEWAMRYGSPADVNAWLQRSVDLVSAELGAGGWMLVEQLPGDPHFGFHAWPVARWRTLGKELGAQGAALRTKAGQWWRYERVFANAIRGADHRDQRPRLWPCGFRCEGGPPSKVWDEIDRARCGDQPARWAKGDTIAQGGTYFAVRLVRQLLEAGDDLGGAPTADDRPRLSCPMNVAREGDRIQVWVDKPSWVKGDEIAHDGRRQFLGPYCEPATWLDANQATGEFTFGKFWSSAAPRPPQPAGPVLRIGE